MEEKEKKKLYKTNIRINDVRGVNRLLQRTINGLIHDEITENKARTIGYLANIMLKGFEIEALENNTNTDNAMGEDWVNAVIEISERRRRRA